MEEDKQCDWGRKCNQLVIVSVEAIRVFILKQSVLRHSLLVFVSIILTLTSALLLTGDFSDSDLAKHVSPLIIPVGIMGLLFSCAGTIYAIYRVFAKNEGASGRMEEES
jgi:arginine exporter protein ArgO